MRQAAFVYDDALARHQLRSDHPMRPVRLQYTHELLQAYGAFDLAASAMTPPREATEEELMWLHGGEYISAVRSFSLGLAGTTRGGSISPPAGTTRRIRGCTMRRS